MADNAAVDSFGGDHQKKVLLTSGEFRKKKSPLTLTDKALERISALLKNKKEDLIGIRITVKQKGCFGFKYNVEYAYEDLPFEEKMKLSYQEEEITVCIDPKAMMFIVGTEMDYFEDKISSGFVFKNPNEKGRCGCGDSFYV